MCKYQIEKVDPNGSRESISTNNVDLARAWIGQPNVKVYANTRTELTEANANIAADIAGLRRKLTDNPQA